MVLIYKYQKMQMNECKFTRLCFQNLAISFGSELGYNNKKSLNPERSTTADPFWFMLKNNYFDEKKY